MLSIRKGFEPAALTPPARAAGLLSQGRSCERAGRIAAAAEAYNAAIEVADERTEAKELAESLRRLAAIHRRQHEIKDAIALCRRSYDVALAAGDNVLAAEALNGIGAAHVERGEWEAARSHFHRAVALGRDSEQLRAMIETNLGIIANIQGDFRAALAHYQRSLEAFRSVRDDARSAATYNNLGMICADQQMWDDADGYFRASLEIADTLGDVALRGHALLNRTEVLLARQHFEDARRSAEEALSIFDQLGARDNKSHANKFLGILYRETGQPVLAEARLRAAMELAADAGSPLHEAEASRELALLYQALSRNQDALKLLSTAHRLFNRLEARADLVDVTAKVEQLEGVYLAIVRNWGRSIESTDSYTFGHSERVARYAASVASVLGLADGEQQTVRLGAYLHDVGKVRVPHQILNKPGRLTDDEMDIMRQHPIYGLELLASVDFPWDIRPIIRSHHERLDGTGYPDKLRGEAVPRMANLICVVDVFDALTTSRSYRPAMPHGEAIAEMLRCRHWWRPEIFDAFLEAVGRETM